MSSKRVVFTFDDQSFNTLSTMQEEGHFKSLAETVRRSLRLARALQVQKQKGFTEIIVRDPQTNKECQLIVDEM